MKCEKRRERLLELLERLTSGVDVAARDMKIILTEEQFTRYKHLWEQEKADRRIEKPKPIKEYESMVKQAHVAEARLQKALKGNKFKSSQQKKRMTLLPRHLTHRAYAFFQNLIEMGYFNYFEYSSLPGPDSIPSVPTGLPVLRGSRSAYHSVSGGYNKRFYKEIIMREALDQLDAVFQEGSEDAVEKTEEGMAGVRIPTD